MSMPSIEIAERLLAEGERMNPGPWAQHSRYVALAARLIANELPNLDGNSAYVLGLLHDIGRREGVYDMRHVLDGFHFMEAQGYSDAARICLTHSFPIPVARSFSGVCDVTPEELQFVQDYLDSIEYTSYDCLIQLCDALALPTGFCLVEKRLMDVALRRGVNEYSVKKWKAYLQIQQDFEAQLGYSIYTLLPGCVKNTFTELS